MKKIALLLCTGLFLFFITACDNSKKQAEEEAVIIENEIAEIDSVAAQAEKAIEEIEKDTEEVERKVDDLLEDI